MVKVNGRYLDREQFKNYLLAEYKVKGHTWVIDYIKGPYYLSTHRKSIKS